MATFFPASMPPRLAASPALGGERRVWQALHQAGLGPGTRIFYNRAPRGCRRRADFLILDPERGLIAIEVKGGSVHYRAGFRQRVPAQRWSKRIEPWAQALRSVQQAFASLNINPLSVPVAAILALPAVSRRSLPFAAAPHLLTSEDLHPGPLRARLHALLPRLDADARTALAPILERIATSLMQPDDYPLIAYAAIACADAGLRWRRIGNAFRNGPRLDLTLNALPIRFDGRIVLIGPGDDPPECSPNISLSAPP